MTTSDYTTAEPLAKAFFDVSFKSGTVPEVEALVNHFQSDQVKTYLMEKAEQAFLAGSQWIMNVTVEELASDNPEAIADMVTMELYANAIPAEGSEVAQELELFGSDLLMAFIVTFFVQGVDWGKTYMKSRNMVR